MDIATIVGMVGALGLMQASRAEEPSMMKFHPSLARLGPLGSNRHHL